MSLKLYGISVMIGAGLALVFSAVLPLMIPGLALLLAGGLLGIRESGKSDE